LTPSHASGVRLDELVRLAVDLINIPSPLYEEGEVASYVGSWLERAGLDVEYQYVSRGRPNVVAWLKGRRDEVRVMMVGHLDTFHVEGEEVRARVEGGYIHGRGSVDMKGAVAAMMLAFSDAARRRPEGTAVLGLVVDEEGKGRGSELLAKSVRAEKAIVGEPTGLSVSPAQSGLLELEIVVRGVRSHVTLPERGASAYEELLKVLELVRSLPPLRERGPLPMMEPTAVVSLVKCGEDPWSTPRECRARVVMSLLPWHDPDALFDEIGRASAQLLSDDCELLVSMVDDDMGFWLADWRGRFSSLLEAVREVVGKVSVSYMRSWCDANNLYHKGGIPTVIFGPGNLGLAHSDSERISVEELLLAARVYREVLARELGA